MTVLLRDSRTLKGLITREMSLINFRSVIYENYCCVYSNVNSRQLQNLFNSLHKLEKSSYVLFIRELPSVSQFTFQVSFAQSYSPFAKPIIIRESFAKIFPTFNRKRSFNGKF